MSQFVRQREIKRTCRRNRPTNDYYIVLVNLPFQFGQFLFCIDWAPEKQHFVVQPIMLQDDDVYLLQLEMSEEIHKILRHYFKRVYGVRHMVGINQTNSSVVAAKLGLQTIARGDVL